MKKKYIPIFLVLILTILINFDMTYSMIKFFPLGDSTIFQYFGYALNKGDKLYLNMFDHKVPAIFFISQLGYFFDERKWY